MLPRRSVIVALIFGVAQVRKLKNERRREATFAPDAVAANPRAAGGPG
jgi:hypothetical protein